MRLVVSWLREFVKVDASAAEIAETLGLRGFEVASLESLPDGDAVIDFEITANPKRPSEIVDLILWIDCPHCGPRKQSAPNFVVDESTTDTVEDIPVKRQGDLHDPKCSGSGPSTT